MPVVLLFASLKLICHSLLIEVYSEITCKLGLYHALLNTLNFLFDLDLQADTAIWAALLLMFYGMLRIGSVLCKGRQCTHERHLVCSDISFSKIMLNVVIRAPKTIQFAARKLELPIPRAKPPNVLCPVQAMLLYVQGAQSHEINDPLFITSDGHMGRPLTATVFTQRLKSVLSSLGGNAQSYAMHSCRRGGASWAYRLDVPVDSIKVIGDWRSLAYPRYIVRSAPSSPMHCKAW